MNINGVNYVCDNCPFFSEPIGCRMDFTANDCELEDAIGFCQCDKTGGKFYLTGFCGEAFDAGKENGAAQNCRKSGRKYRRRQTEIKQKRKLNIINNSNYVCPMWIGESVNNDQYIKYSGKSNYKNYLKKISNKKVRKYNSDVGNGGFYKKLYDLSWELY